MAKLNKHAIKTLTELSRISCSDAEQEALLHDLENILKHFEQLNELDTSNVAPCNNVIAGMANVMREDEIGKILPRDVFLENAPSQIGGMIRVPPVFKAS